MRAFVAVDLPVELHEKITEIQLKFNEFKFKFVDPDLVHVTMKFLGEVPENQIPDISKALDSVKCEPFTSRVKGIGVFPKPKFAKVIWLGCEGNFDVLNEQIENCLSSFEFEPTLHRFSAHATLARVKYLPKKKKTEFLELLDELKDFEIGSMDVSSIKLKKSTLTPKGPIYETLHEVSLQ
ncbi:RNA 2',3'-cyclic phosphodiesterase [Methanolobus sediminis]|uniref:RNA 2',3'-cyclic phosphodiesterase n=1 Tax=Methanolobus sediminis TaxID=3072978 RepID=A0AA51ULQ9_9EURY|nr:RNA 2',3'-cyclic phosphodiesterase [Methanolobus sediminis]WMW25898.1 RNA 2',3'-cyclic phosphodiesterase [Methanolobus sediminis]